MSGRLCPNRHVARLPKITGGDPNEFKLAAGERLCWLATRVASESPTPKSVDSSPYPFLSFKLSINTLDVHSMDRKVNGYLASPPTPASYYYSDAEIHPPAPEDVAAKLRGVHGSLPKAADRVADLIAQEATDRRQMIGGVDNFWLLLSDITDFNPVRVNVKTRS